MVIHKTVKGYVILKNRNDTYDPPTSVSLNWKHWKATWDIKTCKGRKDMHGKIYAISDRQSSMPVGVTFCLLQIIFPVGAFCERPRANTVRPYRGVR